MALVNWKATFDTPGIIFSTYNILSICGKSIMDDPYSFYQPIIKKLMYFKDEFLIIELDLKTLNADSKKQIFRILTTAKENQHIKTLRILWLRDPSDEDGYDLGNEFEKMISIPFEYLDYA